MARPDAYVLQAGFASDPDALLAAQVWTDITSFLDVKAGVRIGRGRTDELSDIQPSVFACTLKNDGRFTPGNTSSPYYPNVKSGKRVRFGVLRKGNSKQIDTDPSFISHPFGGSNELNPWQTSGANAVTIASSATFAQHGSTSMRLTLPTAGTGNAKVRKYIYGLVAGRQYTASVYIRVPSAGPPAMLFGVTGFGSSATTVNDSFQRREVTFTAADCFAEVYVQTNGASTSGQFVYVDAMQMEEGASATAFESTSGTFSWRFTGDSNEWPTAWEGAPAKYATSMMTATDRFKRLGELGELRTTLDEDVIDDFPFAYYPMNEAAGVAASTASAGDISGSDETPLTSRQVGSGGAIGFGHEVGVPDFYVGKRTTFATNPASAGNGLYLRSVLKAAPPAGPGAVGACVNVFSQESLTAYTPSASLAIMTGTDGSWFGVRKASSGNIVASFYNADTGVLSEVVSGVGLSNLVPVMLTARLDIPSAGNGRIRFYANAVEFGAGVTFTMAAVPTWASVSVGGRASELYRGYLSHAAFFNQDIDPGAMAGWWYSAFRGTDGAGATSYARLNKLCVYAKLENPLLFLNQQTFEPADVGPQEIEGPPIDAMRKIETTENGQFFIMADGRSMLLMKNYRYNSIASLTVDSDKLDPDALSFRGDDFGLVNDVTTTRSDGASARVINDTSVTGHGRRKSQFDALSTSDDDLRALAAWRANTWGTQRNRITGVKISLLNDTASIVSALFMDIGKKITITSLPTQAPSASLSLYAEGWTEVISEDEWSMSFNTSPSEPWDVWQIGTAGHSEIGTTTRIGH